MKQMLYFTLLSLVALFACNKSVQERSAAVAVTLKFIDEAGQPVPNVTVDLFLVPDSTQTAYTDTSNLQGLVVFQLSPDSVYQSFAYAVSNINCEYQLQNVQSIESIQQDTTICIQLKGLFTTSQQLIFTAKGRLVNCAGQAVTHGTVRYFGVEYPVNANGEFEIQMPRCANNPPEGELYCVDKSAFKVSTINSIAWAYPIQDFGDIPVCTDPQTFVTLNTSDGLLGELYTGQCHAIDSFQIQFELLQQFTSNVPFVLSLSFTPNPATNMLGNYQTGYAQITATNGQNGYWCSANCVPLTVEITKWEGLGGVAEGNFSGYLPQFGTGNPLTFDGNFSGRFRVPIYH